MYTQMTQTYPSPSYSREDYNSFLPPYYPSPTDAYTTTTPTESFSSDQSAYNTQYPYANQFSHLSPEASKTPTVAYTYTTSPQLYTYTYAYLPPQPLYLNQQSPFWTTPQPSPETPQTTPQARTAPASKPTPTSPHGSDPQTATLKRQRYLHKNSVAATKCRSKKKQYIQQLQSRFEDLSLAKRELQCQVQSLRDGLISLKEELVRHARCGDGPITSYIERRRAGWTCFFCSRGKKRV